MVGTGGTGGTAGPAVAVGVGAGVAAEAGGVGAGVSAVSAASASATSAPTVRAGRWPYQATGAPTATSTPTVASTAHSHRRRVMSSSSDSALVGRQGAVSGGLPPLGRPHRRPAAGRDRW